MLVVRDIGLSPAETLAQLTSDQIELVIVAGRVQLAGPSLHRASSDRAPAGIAAFRSGWPAAMGARSHQQAIGRRRRGSGKRSSCRWKESASCPCCMRKPCVEPTVQLDPQLTSMPILILNVHSHCNCRCIMCDIWKRETHEQVRVADLDRHRASLRNLGVRQVFLTGGEPCYTATSPHSATSFVRRIFASPF